MKTASADGASSTRPYVTFNPLRSLGIPQTRYIKPADMFRRSGELAGARRVLFPEYWQVNSLAYAMKVPLFPSLPTYHLGHDKVEMTRAFLAACPEMVPLTVILSAEEADFDCLGDELGVPFVCKEVRNSAGQGVFLVESRAVWERYRDQNPVIYAQEWLPIDRDLRITVVGTDVVAAYWRCGAPGRFHNNVAKGGCIVREGVPAEAVRRVLDIACTLHIDHAGFDVAVAGDRMLLFEFNPFFGTAGLTLPAGALGRHIHAYLMRSETPNGTPAVA